jgi:hypothetical protein
LGSFINNLLVQTLQTQIEVARQQLPKIAEQLRAAPRGQERLRLSALYDETLRQAESMELQLAALRKQEGEKDGRKNARSETHR